jgi:hypothetical protein
MAKRRSGSSKNEERTEGWIGEELRGCRFQDARQGKRLRAMLEQISHRIGGSIPFACQDWANTKAAYRLLSSDRITEHAILAGHPAATRSRSIGGDGPLLILHDTTTFTYNRGNMAAVGITHRSFTKKDRDGLPQHYVVCGLHMHSGMVVTPEGLPLGLASIHFWTRDRFKGCTAMKRKINPTRVPIEEKESRRWLGDLRRSPALVGRPERCVRIGDRESDIYELFCLAEEVGTHFLVRTCVDRLAGDGSHTIADEMDETRVKGLHRIEVRDRKGELSEAVLEIRCRKILVLPPIGKQKRNPRLNVRVIYAVESGTPSGRDRIEWKLMTDLPVASRKDGVEKLQWYAMRWKIETFHKILKSGCKAEESRLRTAERIINLIAVLCILSWRIFWMTIINRVDPCASADLVFTLLELQLLDRLHKHGADPPARSYLPISSSWPDSVAT